MLKSCGDRTLINKFPFLTTKLNRVYFLPYKGIEKEAYGGRCQTIADVADTKYYIAVDKDLNTIDVLEDKK